MKKVLLNTRWHLLYLKPFVPSRKSDPTLHLLSAVDLIDSSQIQHVLLRQSLWEARESPLSIKRLFQAIQELFQGVRVQEPGQVHPRASELTLSLLTTMYDRWGCRDDTETPVAVLCCHRSLAIWCCVMTAYGLIYKVASLFSTNALFIQEGNEEDMFISFTNIKDPWIAKREKSFTLLFSVQIQFHCRDHTHP